MNQSKYIEKIFKQYTTKEPTELDNLKSLDKKVKTPAKVFTYIFGIIGSLILGTGLCLAMQVIGGTTPLMITGIVIGIVGIIMVSINYSIYSKILSKRKSKYADQILQKSNDLLNK